VKRSKGYMSNFLRGIIAVLVAALLLIISPAAPIAAAVCTLSAADFKSLELSSSGIKTQTEVDALPEARQKTLCSTRTQWNQIQSSGQFTDGDAEYSPFYLSPKERSVYGKLTDAYTLAHISHLSPEEWDRQRQQILNGLVH
jgi:hypothetical protein